MNNLPCPAFPRAPALPPPSGKITRVRNTDELVKAIAEHSAGETILLTDGLYTPPPDLLITKHNVSLRGESGDRDKVVIDGGGVFSIMLAVKGAHDTLISDMTFRNCLRYGIFIFGDSDAQRTQIYNCAFHNIWTRSIKGTHAQRPDDKPEPLLPVEHALKCRPSGGSIRYCLFSCDSKKSHDDLFDGDYISGIDMMWLKNWTISDNVFHGIRGRNGGGRGAIFIWVNSEDVIAERNLIVDCDRGICFGNPSGDPPHMTGGIIRRNAIVSGTGKAIELCAAIDCEISYNTVFETKKDFEQSVHVFWNSRGAKVHHNLIHGRLLVEVEAEIRQNDIRDRLADIFSDAASGNISLKNFQGGKIKAGHLAE